MRMIETDPKLLAALHEASRTKITAAQRRRQRISFIMGTLDDKSPITRERVEEVLQGIDGEKTTS